MMKLLNVASVQNACHTHMRPVVCESFGQIFGFVFITKIIADRLQSDLQLHNVLGLSIHLVEFLEHGFTHVKV